MADLRSLPTTDGRREGATPLHQELRRETADLHRRLEIDLGLLESELSLDRYRRVLAVCAMPDGSDLNGWLVQQGWALAYGYSSLYRSQEAEAHAAKRGIWAGSFIPPWEWRHRRRG